jgi:hemerythrin-like metal-binding protein
VIYLTKDLLTNVPEIDSQHEEFIACLNHLVDAITALERAVAEDAQQKVKVQAALSAKEQVRHALDTLGDYIVKHFHDEEELQAQYKYPHIEWHQELHRWYVAEYNQMKEEYLANGITAAFMESLKSSMVNWVAKHITAADISLGRHINKQILLDDKHWHRPS